MDIITVEIIVIIVAIAILTLAIGGKKSKNKKSKEDFYKEQQDRVNVGGYKIQPLLNKTEEISRQAISKALEEKDYRIYAQVNLGEFLKHENWKLYKDISSKRADFVITDIKNIPIGVIEIHGQGHYQGKTATKRDEIKKAAIEDAGIKYLAIAVGKNEKTIYTDVLKKVKVFI